MDKGGSRIGVSLSEEAVWRASGEGFFIGDPERSVK
jgi:hypothetical protein